jgi:hypothetical protein
MNMQKSLMVLAGAAMGLSPAALAQQSADDVRALKSDASTRSSFQGDADTPSLTLGGYTQFQYNLNFRDDGGNNEGAVPETMTNGFRFANTKLNGRGNVTEEWSYFFQAAFAPEGGAFNLQDMYAQYTMDNGWNVQAGQKKLPFLREELVSDTGQQAAERSVYNEEFTAGRAQGIFVNYDQENFRIMGAFSDGARTQNTEFDSAAEADYAFTARGEWKWAGEWDRFNQFSSWNGNENAGMVGGAFQYQDGGSTNGTADVEIWAVTTDVTIQGSGWNVFAAAAWQHSDPDLNDERDGLGFLAQGGFFVTDDWELFLRGTFTFPDDNEDLGPGPDEFWTLTGGANYFITPQSQNAKLTFQVTYAGEGTSSDDGANNFLLEGGSGSASSGLLPDVEGGQFNIRAGLQIKF